jgi:hypothetical protein
MSAAVCCREHARPTAGADVCVFVITVLKYHQRRRLRRRRAAKEHPATDSGMSKDLFAIAEYRIAWPGARGSVLFGVIDDQKFSHRISVRCDVALIACLHFKR